MYKLAPQQGEEELFLCLPFVARLLTLVRSRESRYGLLFGCRSRLDAEREKEIFFGDVRKNNWPKTGTKIFI